MRRMFHGPPSPADWLVPLGLILAQACVLFVISSRREAALFTVPPSHVDDIRNALAFHWAARLLDTVVLVGIAAALALASRQRDVRRAALLTFGAVALLAVVGRGWLTPLAEDHRHAVVTRIDAETLREAGLVTRHEPFPLQDRLEAWTWPQLARAALTGAGPAGPVGEAERSFATRQATGTLRLVLAVALPFLACCGSRRLRFAWPVVLALGALSFATWMLVSSVLRQWLMSAYERGGTPLLREAVSLTPYLIVGAVPLALAWRFGLPRDVAPEAPLLSRGERVGTAGLVLAATLVVIGSTFSLDAAITRAEPPPGPGTGLVGKPAPTLTAATWLGADEPPSPDTHRDRPVLVDFWGTWCGPCVRSMPRIQQLHDELGPLGLGVVAITYEDAETVKPFLTANGYTFATGCDTASVSVKAWKVAGWPTTYLIGRDGNVAAKDGSASIEAAARKELGLPSDPCAVLAMTSDPDPARSRWATTYLAREAPVDHSATDCPGVAPAVGSVRAWARAELRRRHPLTADEVALLLRRGAHATLLDDLLLRGAPEAVLASIAQDPPLREGAAARAGQLRRIARSAVLGERWILGPRMARDQGALWEDVAVSGARPSCERSGTRMPRTLTLHIEGRELAAPSLRGLARDRMAQALLSEDLARGRSLRLDDLDARVDAELETIARDSEERYAWR